MPDDTQACAPGGRSGFTRGPDRLPGGRPGRNTSLLMAPSCSILQGIADGQATKIFLPLDTSGLLGSVAAIGELLKKGAGSTGGDGRTS